MLRLCNFCHFSQHNMACESLINGVTLGQQSAVTSAILSLTPNTNHTLYLFTSPEALIQPIWSLLIKQLINKQTLSLVCVDKAHLFIHFVNTFCSSIISLRSLLFDLLHSSHQRNDDTQQLMVPVLSMRATFNDNMKILSNKTIGLKIRIESTFWSGTRSFSCHNSYMNVSLMAYKMKVLKEEVLVMVNKLITTIGPF